MRAITLAICCLLGALLTPALQAAPADCQAEGSFTVHLSSLDQQLLTILGAGANNGDTPELIRYNERTDSINKPILGNYAIARKARGNPHKPVPGPLPVPVQSIALGQ